MNNVLITGAAGGIGSAIAHIFAQNNFFVYAVDIDAEACENLVKSIGSERCCAVTLDVTDNDAVESFAASLPSDFELNHLICLAGRALDDEWLPFAQLDSQVIERSVQLNLISHIQVTRAMYPFLLNSKEDKSVTLISSINAKGCFGLPIYSAAKAGLSGFMNGALNSFGRDGVRINIVSPGTVVTEATLNEPKDFEHLLKGTALNRFATAEDVAKLVLRISGEFVTITGHDFVVDAGQLCNHGG